MNGSTTWTLLSVTAAAGLLAYVIAELARARSAVAPSDADAISRWDDEGGSVAVARVTTPSARH